MDAATIVQRIRASSGVTRTELANLAQVAPSTIGRIESGKLDPTWGTLNRILEATGFRISGDSIVSAGDASAAAAARRPLELALASLDLAASDAVAPALSAIRSTPSQLARQVVDTRAVSRLSASPALRESVDVWLKRWSNAGWLTDELHNEGIIAMAAAAGNASKLVRRDALRRYAGDRRRWQELARQIGAAGIEYGVSGLLAARDDRTTANSVNPLIYVSDPDEAMSRLDLVDSAPGQGVLLLETAGAELENSEMDDGIMFTSPAQAILDALAGSGREPDKAESALHRMLEASV